MKRGEKQRQGSDDGNISEMGERMSVMIMRRIIERNRREAMPSGNAILYDGNQCKWQCGLIKLWAFQLSRRIF